MAFSTLSSLYERGWNPATGKLRVVGTLAHAMPLMACTEEPDAPDSRDLTSILNFAVKQDIKDITNMDLQAIFPKHIAYHYRGLQFRDTRQQVVHIRLEPRSGLTAEESANSGVDGVIIKVRATRNGLINFVGFYNDYNFARELVYSMGLVTPYLNNIELLEEGYVEDYYDDIHRLGF